MKYPHCQSKEEQVKAGFNTSGSQRYKCNKCQKRYTITQVDRATRCSVEWDVVWDRSKSSHASDARS
jgi:transposase-like protein